MVITIYIYIFIHYSPSNNKQRNKNHFQPNQTVINCILVFLKPKWNAIQSCAMTFHLWGATLQFEMAKRIKRLPSVSMATTNTTSSLTTCFHHQPRGRVQVTDLWRVLPPGQRAKQTEEQSHRWEGLEASLAVWTLPSMLQPLNEEWKDSSRACPSHSTGASWTPGQDMNKLQNLPAAFGEAQRSTPLWWDDTSYEERVMIHRYTVNPVRPSVCLYRLC